MYDKNHIINSEQIDLGVKHHFSDSVYAKEMHLPEGHVALSHSHRYSHISILSAGSCKVSIKGEPDKIYNAPVALNIKAGIEHEILALTDVVWFCVHSAHLNEKIDNVPIIPPEGVQQTEHIV